MLEYLRQIPPLMWCCPLSQRRAPVINISRRLTQDETYQLRVSLEYALTDYIGAVTQERVSDYVQDLMDQIHPYLVEQAVRYTIVPVLVHTLMAAVGVPDLIGYEGGSALLASYLGKISQELIQELVVKLVTCISPVPHDRQRALMADPPLLDLVDNPSNDRPPSLATRPVKRTSYLSELDDTHEQTPLLNSMSQSSDERTPLLKARAPSSLRVPQKSNTNR